ncbi:MAG: DUF3822 family protein [Paludibacter sp.]|nr:DUF3822 family protein [Paludibacter sp.]
MAENKSNTYSLIFRSANCVCSVHNEFGEISRQRWPLDLWHDSEEDLVRILAQATAIQHNSENIRIICQSKHFTFIPMALFSQDDAHYFLDFQGKTENSAVICNIIEQKEIAVIFAVPLMLVKSLSRFFDNAKINLHLTEIINNQQNTRGNYVQIYFAENIFDILIFEKKRLFFYNSFKFNTKEDVSYFLTVIFEQFSLSFEQTEIFVYNAENQKDTIDLLKKSFKSILMIPSIY